MSSCLIVQVLYPLALWRSCLFPLEFEYSHEPGVAVWTQYDEGYYYYVWKLATTIFCRLPCTRRTWTIVLPCMSLTGVLLWPQILISQNNKLVLYIWLRNAKLQLCSNRIFAMYGNPTPKNSMDIEALLYEKSKTKVTVLLLVWCYFNSCT